MLVCMCSYVSVCIINVFANVHFSALFYVLLCIRLFMLLDVGFCVIAKVSKCTYLHMRVSVCVYMYVYSTVYKYIYMFVCMCVSSCMRLLCVAFVLSLNDSWDILVKSFPSTLCNSFSGL